MPPRVDNSTLVENKNKRSGKEYILNGSELPNKSITGVTVSEISDGSLESHISSDNINKK